ncbi:hypothetical protein [Kocuria palustris]|uniref:hypothetical protein n=1 Tax=Kocuria palustris TaxID=71999 RepID=UPI002044B895|nr:hypothetical protein [Kocuria palustris]MCM3332703.1 hypothetical protein [Kocuria palustris]
MTTVLPRWLRGRRPQAPWVWAALLLWAALLVAPILLANAAPSADVAELYYPTTAGADAKCTPDQVEDRAWLYPAVLTAPFLVAAGVIYTRVRPEDTSVSTQRARVAGLKWLMITTTIAGVGGINADELWEQCSRLALVMSLMGPVWAVSGIGAVILHMVDLLLAHPDGSEAEPQG